MKTRIRSFGGWAVIGIAVFGARPTAARGDTVLTALESDQFRGHFDQNGTSNASVDGKFFIVATSGVPHAEKAPEACVPTSMANSFVYLKDQFGIKGLGGGGNPTIEYDTINTLASAKYMNTKDQLPSDIIPPAGYMPGTSFRNAATGTEKFLQNNAATITDKNNNPIAIQTVGQDAFGFSQAADGPYIGGISAQKPTATFIQQQLEAKEDVELFFRWTNSLGQPTGGGHCVDLYGIDFNATANSGSISFIDPTNSSNGKFLYGSGDAPAITSSSLTMMANGFLRFQYFGGAAGIAMDDNLGGSTYGVVTAVLAESPFPLPAASVPAPAPLLGGLLLLAPLWAASRRRKMQ
jgi:hypothetical protein